MIERDDDKTMILKEAYRYQNYCTKLLNLVSSYLRRSPNVMLITSEHLRSKSQPDAVDETTNNLNERELTVPVNHIVKFGMALIDEKMAIAEAIDNAKAQHCQDVDRGLAINRLRQEFLGTLKNMASMKKRERVIVGTAMCFNVEGNQVAYRYDVKEVQEPDFDKVKIKEAINSLQEASDAMSNHADYCLTSVAVDFEPNFNINDTFEEQVEMFSNALTE